jgi:hypothetical protein
MPEYEILRNMMKKNLFPKYLAALSLLLFLVPAVTFADTPITFSTTASSHEALIATLNAQIFALKTQLLAALQAQVAALTATNPPLSISNVTVYPASVIVVAAGQSADLTNISQTNATVGSIRVSFSGFKHLQTPNGLPSTSPAYQPFGELLLSYSPCPSSFCPNATYISMPSELWLGQSTNFMNETLTLSGMATSSVYLTATPTHN